MKCHTNVSKSLRRVSLVHRTQRQTRCLLQLLLWLYQLSSWLIYPLGKSIILVISESPTTCIYIYIYIYTHTHTYTQGHHSIKMYFAKELAIENTVYNCTYFKEINCDESFHIPEHSQHDPLNWQLCLKLLQNQS